MNKIIFIGVILFLITNTYAFNIIIYDSKNIIKERTIHVFNQTTYTHETKFGENIVLLNGSSNNVIIEPKEIDVLTNIESINWYGYAMFFLSSFIIIILIILIIAKIIRQANIK